MQRCEHTSKLNAKNPPFGQRIFTKAACFTMGRMRQLCPYPTVRFLAKRAWMRSNYVRILALVALCLHLVAPSVAMVASSDRVDVSSFICVTPGTAQSDAQARMAERLAELLEPGEKAPQLDDDTCSHCIMSAGTILPDQINAIEFRLPIESQSPMTFDAGLVKSPRGPPVGATGPPRLQWT